MKALAEHTASSNLRRALLRKTRNQQDLQGLQPGQAVAFWRWSGRSRQHKKGAWALARFISHDTDGKSIWVQVNTTTIKVANNQVRNACGWEDSEPRRHCAAEGCRGEHSSRPLGRRSRRTSWSTSRGDKRARDQRATNSGTTHSSQGRLGPTTGGSRTRRPLPRSPTARTLPLTTRTSQFPTTAPSRQNLKRSWTENCLGRSSRTFPGPPTKSSWSQCGSSTTTGSAGAAFAP